MHANTFGCPFDSKDMKALDLTMEADFQGCPVKEYIPKRAINYSLKPKHFWYSFMALPLPPTHNIPLGQPMDLNTMPLAALLIDILCSYTGHTGTDEKYELLDNEYADAYLWGCCNHKEHSKSKLCSLPKSGAQ
jgi:hypothetical protein